MMSDYDRTMELIDAAYNSAGKSQQQFAKNMETIEFKTKRLKNSWETLRQSFVNSDFFKGATDSANNLLQSLNELSGWDYAALAATFLVFGKTVITNIVKGMGQISEVEEQLQASRRVYNSNVSVFNQEIIVFPTSIVARHYHFEKRDFFEAEEAKRADVKIDF